MIKQTAKLPGEKQAEFPFMKSLGINRPFLPVVFEMTNKEVASVRVRMIVVLNRTFHFHGCNDLSKSHSAKIPFSLMRNSFFNHYLQNSLDTESDLNHWRSN